MKILKVLLVVCVILTAVVSSQAEIASQWRVVQSGGQLNGLWPFRWVGFDYVHQDPIEKTLTCSGGGYSECELKNLVQVHRIQMHKTI